MQASDILIWLNAVPGLGSVRIRAILDHFKDTQAIAEADEKNLKHVRGIGPGIARAIRKTAPHDFIQRERETAHSKGIDIITSLDANYPPGLAALYDPPLVLYVRGEIMPEDIMSVALVGARRCTAYGRTQAAKLARGLAVRGITVVSGCARGIDGAAHTAALKAGGRTIGVIGSGLLQPYPPEHIDMMAAISRQGALVSEFHLNQGVERGNFVRRNRIIAGLSLGTVVIEAGKRSGALITARHAGEQGREVFAVPGNVESPVSKGSHMLLKDGAGLIENADDIISGLGDLGRYLPVAEEAPEPPGLSVKLNDAEQSVFELIAHEPLHIEEIIDRSRLAPGSAAGALTLLEVKNLIKELPGKKYVRV